MDVKFGYWGANNLSYYNSFLHSKGSEYISRHMVLKPHGGGVGWVRKKILKCSLEGHLQFLEQ